LANGVWKKQWNWSLKKMEKKEFADVFTQNVLSGLFPAEKADNFFELLYGDAREGAYDIELSYSGRRDGALEFSFQLKRRPGKCLACNLTYGLPDVFARHPELDVKGLVEKFAVLMDGRAAIVDWRLGRTVEKSKDLHVIPLEVSIEEN
jgi:hypothetical protein